MTSSAQPTPTRRPGWFRWTGFALGLVLLSGAVYAVVRDRQALEATIAGIRAAPLWLVALLFILPAINWLLTAEVFWLLMQPGPDETYQPPSRREMRELIGAAWLANYLPIRPGLFGRIAWHKRHGQIPIARSIHSVVTAIFCGIVAVGLLLGGAWALPQFTPTSTPWTIATVVTPPIMLALLAIPAGRIRPQWRWLLLACSVRCLDVIVWMGRYWVVFAIGGTHLNLREAASIAAVSQAASMIPFAGNGLGIREAAVGMAGAWLPSWYLGGSDLSAPIALAADVVNRAGELLSALVVGTICGVLLARRMNAGDRT